MCAAGLLHDTPIPFVISCVSYSCRNTPRNLSAGDMHAELRAAAHIANAKQRAKRLESLGREAIGMCRQCAEGVR